MRHCLARDQSPPGGGSIGGHIKGQLRVGRLAIPISLVKPLPAGSFARSISRTAVLPSVARDVSARLLSPVRRQLGDIGGGELRLAKRQERQQIGRAGCRERGGQYV